MNTQHPIKTTAVKAESSISKEVPNLELVKRNKIIVVSSAAVGMGLFGIMAMAKQVPGIIIAISMAVTTSFIFLMLRIGSKGTK